MGDPHPGMGVTGGAALTPQEALEREGMLALHAVLTRWAAQRGATCGDAWLATLNFVAQFLADFAVQTGRDPRAIAREFAGKLPMAVEVVLAGRPGTRM